jgi:cytochrome P450
MEASFLQELANAMGHGRALRDQVLHIFLASRDTTASLLSNLFFALAKKPDVYARLRKEVTETVGDCSPPTFEQLKNITYLKWCINECES